MLLAHSSVEQRSQMLVLAYEDLGTEAIYRFVIEDFPAVVAVDSFGNDVYKFGAEKYRK